MLIHVPEQPEVTVPLPAVGSMESGRSLGKTLINPLPHPLTRPSHLQSGRPRPRPVRGVGRNGGTDEAFNLYRRIYPDTSIIESMSSVPTPSARLLATEEGYISVSPGNSQMPYLGQVRLPVPRRHYDMQTNKDHELQDQLGHDEIIAGMISSATREFPTIILGGIILQVGLGCPLWPLPPIDHLPAPFAPHRYPGYSYDPTIRWPPGARGPANYTSAASPFCGAHNVDHANPSGNREWSERAYRRAMVYNPIPSDAGAPPDAQEGTEHSAGTVITGSVVRSGPSDPLAGDIVNTSGI
ncbi:hypothetical protein EDC04DRAFT_2798963 [Pisolithus marmoratus]|nr:hypothetical protein EDC04DRAFT_2798963 [Pisolithus marmoratus]